VVRFDVLLDGEPTSNPESGAKPSDLVCIIYTSGSTGVPKGVAARHSNLANYIQFIVQRLGYPHGWHFATVSTISAILGNTSVFGSLMSGGCLHVIDYETALAPNLFADYVAKYPIDVMKIAPSQLSTLLNGSEGRRIVPRQYLAVGGEKFTWELVEQIRANGSCKVMNHYGPTETMGCCTFVADDHDFRDWKPATVPLGRPMSNQQLYIVDRYLRPVPVGVPGELCMSGAGLTDGYFNQPNQTAERFVPNPFSTDKTSRLYRTGDLARFLPDGNIEFLGRIDHQVKIRGFRVEPAEVEAVLGKLPNIKQAVVVPEDNSAGEKLLAAYVVPSGAVQSSDIYALLRQKLPEYMVPSRMLLLESLPLNRNGKVDLPALAGLQADDKSKERELAAPRNAVEEQLTAIWKEVLKQDKIDIHDNFFELGGHSLLATQVISRIRSTFGLQLPIMDLLLSPTIAELSEKISQHPDLVLTDEETERLLRELEGMSDEEAESLLAPERNRTGDVKANSGSTPQS
jgi:amino acid adenylation domain-containing protein